MKGKLIVFEGMDASGKKTQLDLLIKKLKKKKDDVEAVDFPRYDSKEGKKIASYLKGEIGTLNVLNPYEIARLYAEDRLACRDLILKWLDQGKIVISNRYIASNKAYQGAKIRDNKERDSFINFIDELEYKKNNMPREDIVLFLYVPLDLSQKLLKKKGYRDYMKNNEKDIHEENFDYLKEVEKGYLEFSKNNKWHKINCTKDGEILSPEMISEKIFSIIKKIL